MATKLHFDPRRLMEMAIEAMRQSINEPRDDDAVPPKVGAVLWKPDGTIETAEERGLGLKSMKSRATEAELPLPKYTWEDPYLVLTLYRSPESAAKGLGKGVIAELTQEEQKGWAFLASRTGTTQSEYARNLEVTARTAQRHLTHFVELGLLRRVGAGPATEYLKP